MNWDKKLSCYRTLLDRIWLPLVFEFQSILYLKVLSEIRGKQNFNPKYLSPYNFLEGSRLEYD